MLGILYYCFLEIFVLNILSNVSHETLDKSCIYYWKK